MIYKEIFNTINCPPTWIINTQGEIIAVNSSFSRLLGLSPDLLVGKNMETISSLQITMHPQILLNKIFQRGLQEPCYAKIIKNGQPDLTFKIFGKALTSGSEAVLQGEPVQLDANGNIGECLRFYVQEITRAQEDERLRIARELHDGTIQSLIVMLHGIENFLHKNKQLPMNSSRLLWSLTEQLRDVLQETRHLSMNLRPIILDDLGLIPALEWLVEELKNNYCIKASLVLKGTQQRLAHEIELGCFRIVQESLNNVLKHSKATMVKVCIEYSSNDLKITIEDDGIGIELPDSLQELLWHGKFGLAGIFERVQVLRGYASATPKGNGTGTCIKAVIPLN